ncbi:uncharacterized protein si:dkey-112e17.1 [Triplophysa rosa]|uniref:CUB domain-containing protein n=1 Tax=Triplophysa rosa TaxID=992332 RepID=A0A9W8CBB9_TRIRA|nr:uncharacterized protein si:dkey-112e17.1 [Triplophysa rosa]KAI7813224.1 hypothetical protein IRJ41_016175 [Triplophysa rosa]
MKARPRAPSGEWGERGRLSVSVFAQTEVTKMGLRGLSGTRVYATVCLLWMSGCVAQKVYFDCGAKVDVVDVQGLILSPGFPYNYSSGTHCVWQFFVPVGHQLILEMFDFDVFESPDNPTESTSTSADNVDEVPTDDSTVVSKGLANSQSIGGPIKEPQSARREEVKQVVVQEQSSKMEMTKVSNSAKMLADSPSAVPLAPQTSSPLSGAQNGEKKVRNSVSLQRSRVASDPADFVTASPRTATEMDEEVSAYSQTPLLDACPHDVLYISDLITFSSRFCGSRRPSSSQLVFGSEDDMVEVIMELITTTHWGRGFALLFHYQNQTQAAMIGHQKSASPSDGGTSAMLGAVSGAVVFAMCLAGILCVIFRPKLCPKEAATASSISSEVPEGVLNSAADVSELQMVSSNRLEQQMGTVNDNNNHSLHHSLSHTGSSVNAEKTALEMFSSDLTELELGTDEVFVNISPAKLPISAHTQRERFLRHSDTGPSRLFDWPSPDSALPTATKSSFTGSANSARPRAWSVRTFQDLLPPLPQVHKKWCSWNSTSPFTKLVDSGLPSRATDGGRAKILSDTPLQSPDESSFISNASYPLTQSAQRQRRLNSTCNLRRTRFNAPCFGLLSGASESSKPQGSTTVNGNTTPNQFSEASSPSGQQHVQGRLLSGDDDHVTVPVFAISEEEDRQPLVLAERHDKSLKTSEQKCEGLIMPLLSKGQLPTVQSTDRSIVRGDDGLTGGHGGMSSLMQTAT